MGFKIVKALGDSVTPINEGAVNPDVNSGSGSLIDWLGNLGQIISPLDIHS